MTLVAKPPESFLNKSKKYIDLIKEDRTEELNVDDMDFIEQLAFRRALLKAIFEEGVYDDVFDNLYKKILIELQGGKTFEYNPFLKTIAVWWHKYLKKRHSKTNKAAALREVEAAVSELRRGNLIKLKEDKIGIGPCFTFSDMGKYVELSFERYSFSALTLPLPFKIKNNKLTNEKLGKTDKESKLPNCTKLVKVLNDYIDRGIIEIIEPTPPTKRFGVPGIQIKIKKDKEFNISFYSLHGKVKSITSLRRKDKYKNAKKFGIINELAEFSGIGYFIEVTPLGKYVQDILKSCVLGNIDEIDTSGKIPPWRK